MEEHAGTNAMKSDTENCQSPTFTTFTGPYDVLIGRGASISKLPGNAFFRQLLQERRDQYTSTCRRQLKNEIADQIIFQISQRNGRFLREVKKSEGDSDAAVETKRWIIVDHKVVAATIKQTLRETNIPLHEAETITPETPQSSSSEENDRIIGHPRLLTSEHMNAALLRSHMDHNFVQRNTLNHQINQSDQQLTRTIQQHIDNLRSRFECSEQSVHTTLSHFDSRRTNQILSTLTQLLSSNIATEINRASVVTSRSPPTSNLLASILRQEPASTSPIISTSSVEMSLLESFIRDHQSTREDIHSVSINSVTNLTPQSMGLTQSTVSGLLQHILRIRASAEYLSRNNIRINTTDNSLGMLARSDGRNALLHDYESFDSSSLFHSRRFQSPILDRFQVMVPTDRRTEVRSFNNSNSVQASNVVRSFSMAMDRVDSSSSDATSIDEIAAQSVSARAIQNTFETNDSKLRRAVQRHIDSMTQSQKRKFQSDDDHTETSH
jgi:hypothetical protein